MPTLRSIFLTSGDPESTAKFYQQVASLPLERIGEEGGYFYWKVDQGDIQLAIHASAPFAPYAEPPLRRSNLTHLYFKIENQAAFLAHLASSGIEPEAIDDVTVTVEDPDGRKVLFGLA
jgi:hypothetical protein